MKRNRRSAVSKGTREPMPEREPLWYKDAVFYEIRIGTFQDGDGDGIGDIRGLTSRLDYLQDLGVTVLWLLPFCPSPLRDDGYDISDYTDVNPDLGTLDDFRTFLREAHRRGLRIVTELVINHTSEQHPWFQRARRAPADSRWRNWYVWSDSPDRYPDVRIIFKDFERSNWTWDPVANAYYWHRFYAHQPDLNFDNPEVQREVMRALDFWFGLGVDGLRLDAIPYLFEREGTNCENLPETHGFLKALRAHVDARWQDRMLLAEANQWPEDAVTYFGDGDECHMSFHFPVMPRLFMSLHMEDRYPIIDILNQTPPIPENCQWALFLRNHDELTLEMVTDEERDYMYRVYAHDAKARINLGIRRRLAPLLGNDRRRIELLNALLFSMPGTPVLYYGDEIGMGDNFYLGDRNGVRTPMQWSSDRNAGFSTANSQRLFLPIIIDPEYHYESVNVEAQRNNPHSLLNWMKRLIALRRRTRALSRGSIEFLHPSNRKVLAFIREWDGERILVVANLSRFVEYVELDLAKFKGMVAVEMFARSPFPPIGDLPYLLTLGPHSFYWFSIEAGESRGEALESAVEQRPSVRSAATSIEALLERDRAALEAVLPEILRGRRWYGAKAARLRSAKVVDAIPVGSQGDAGTLLLVRTELEAGGGELYAVPVSLARGEDARRLLRNAPHVVLADLVRGAKDSEPQVLFDALEDPEFCTAWLDGIGRRKRWRGAAGELLGGTTKAFRTVRGDPETKLPATLLHAEQSNSSVVYGDRLVLKLFRRLSVGTNPDLEIGRFLTERTEFSQVPTTAGFLEYRAARSEPITIGVLQNWVENEGDAWHWTRDHLMRFYEDALVAHADEQPPASRAPLLEISEGPPPPTVVLEMLGSFLETMRLLGRRTGEMHLALASDREDPEFAPERFSTLHQRSLYQSMRNLSARTLDTLRANLASLSPDSVGDAQRLIAAEDQLGERFRSVLGERIDALRIRCHGDLHLGQVLFTGSDFVIIDFEGEPARPLGERRLKRSPLADVAGMLRSFDYAARGFLMDFAREGTVRAEDVPALEPWSAMWTSWVSSAYLRAYLRAVEGTNLVPGDRRQLETLLAVLLLEKAVYELGYELNNRPSWVTIPLRSILALIEPAEPDHGGDR
jgi:maltose alpha-D-glucosyltransferase/alpha-amylase